MGNSGSIHNVAIDLDENQYSHNYNQQLAHEQHQQHPIHWSSSYPANSSGLRVQQQVKVLPEPLKLSHLRPTTNGTILHSGGTISGRREPTGSSLLLQRSRTTLIESPGHFRRTASGQYAESRKSARTPSAVAKRTEAGEIKGHNVAVSKKFGSEPDLRNHIEDDGNNNSFANNRLASPSKSKMVKSKKKALAPQPTPKVHNEIEPLPVKNVQPQRKLRLFKTRAESRKPLERAPNNNSKIAAEASDFHFRHHHASERLTSSQRKGVLGKIKQEPEKREDVPNMKPNPPVFRREKSFDITLLRSRNRDLHSPENANSTQIPSDLSTVHQKGCCDSTEMASNRHILSYDTKSGRQRKISQYGLVVEDDQSFKVELEAATKRRSIAALEDAQRQADAKPQKIPSTQKFQKDLIISPIGRRFASKVVPQRDQSDTLSKKKPNNDKDVSTRGLIQLVESKNPQSTKTFYFGMGKSSTDVNRNEDSNPFSVINASESDSFAKIQMDVIDQFAKSIFTTPEYERAESESSESALSFEEGCRMLPRIDCTSQDEENDAQIQVYVRPTLPRKQLEIPRFSPTAAWRMLNEDRLLFGGRQGGFDGITNETFLEAAQPSQPIEGRIQRIYREPNPMYPDNKSGDSGISGDAGLPERVDSPKNQRLTSIVGPFLTAWTPQQDLDEEEDDVTSSDDDLGKGNKEDTPHKYPSRGHTFSLSLPRENQLSIYEEKDKPGFSSLQKLKRTVSGVFASQTNGNRSNGNYRNDNWLLSRSAPNSIDNSQISPTLPNNASVQDSTNHSSSTLSYLTAGRHIMYLPNQPTDGINNADFRSIPIPLNSLSKNQTNHEMGLNGLKVPDHQSICQQANKEMETSCVDGQNEQKTTSSSIEESVKVISKKNRGGHRFTFQSTVRQIERRRLADKLSKEAEQKEAQRISELEAMRRVEEEFQRKRAGEKASIRHQLRLFSLEENQCSSLPVDWQTTQGFNNNNNNNNNDNNKKSSSNNKNESSSNNNKSSYNNNYHNNNKYNNNCNNNKYNNNNNSNKGTNTNNNNYDNNNSYNDANHDFQMDNLPYRNSQQQRADPDGAVSSSPAASPILRSHSKMRPNSNDNRQSGATAINAGSKTQHFIKKDEMKIRMSSRPRQQRHPSPQTEVLSEFRTPRREYFEYRSINGSSFRHFEQPRTEHDEVICNIPTKSSAQPQQQNDRSYKSEVNGDLYDSRFFSNLSYNNPKKLTRLPSPPV